MWRFGERGWMDVADGEIGDGPGLSIWVLYVVSCNTVDGHIKSFRNEALKEKASRDRDKLPMTRAATLLPF